MAAPSVTAVGAAAGIMMDDGHPTKIAFSRLPTVSLKEVSVQPPGVDGRDPIDITTMRSTRWTSRAPRTLLEMSDGSAEVAYDPNAYNQIVDTLLNQEGSVTWHFPDGTTMAAWAFLQKFEPNEHTEGEMPTANITIVVTNYDPTNRVEAGPVITSVAGT